MKSKVHDNSIEAYHGLKLSKRQAEVVKALQLLGQATDQRIADYLGYTVNRVTGRVTELRDKGVVVEDHSIRGEFGQPNRVCRLADCLDSIDMLTKPVEKKSKRKQVSEMTLSMAASIMASARGRKPHNTKQGLLFAGA